MIKNNLSILLAERQLKISKLSNETGISRTTLTSLSNNNSKMVQLEIINKLCQALNIVPENFFEYVPFDFDYFFDIGDLDEDGDFEHGEPLFFDSTFIINISKNGQRTESIEFEGYTEELGYSNNGMDLGLSLHPADKTQLKNLKTYLDSLSVAFVENVKKDIKSFLTQELEDRHSETGEIFFTIGFDKTRSQFNAEVKQRNNE